MAIFKRTLLISLRISISIILLIFLLKFNKIDVRSLLDNIKSANKSFLSIAFFIFLLNYILCFYRWEMLLKAAKIHIPLKRIIISFAGSMLFNLFLPSTIGGDLTRTIDLAMHTKRPREVVVTVFLDRLSGYVGLVIVVSVSLLFGWRFIQGNKIVLVSVPVIAAILIVILLVLFNKSLYNKINKLLHSSNAGRIRELIKSMHQEIHIFRHRKKVIINSLILSILIQVIFPVACFAIALSLGVKLNIVYFFIFLPIISAVSLLPVSMGGLGIRESLTVLLFARVGVSQSLALGMSLLYFLFILIYGAMGGLIYVLTVHHRRIQHYKTPSMHATPQ